MSSPWPVGLHETLVTHDVSVGLSALPHRLGPVDDADLPTVLASYLARQVDAALRRTPAAEQVALANRILAVVGGDAVEPPTALLLAVLDASPGSAERLSRRPAVPLSRPALLTNASADPGLGAELRAELHSADRVDLLCAFVKWHGLRTLESELAAAHSRGVPIRVVTTTYLGATDRRALDRLVRDFGAQVKVNYETLSTRLHAKAWLFGRRTGFDTAYVGSSNLSRAALLDGLEWNVRLSGVHTPELLGKFAATFDAYWAEDSFLAYDPDRDGDQLDEALRVAAGRHERGSTTLTVSGLQVRPYPHQQAILDRLELERTWHGHHRNLVVAATGTGKTVVAALDYARMPGRPPLLFVAHREELLRQALRTYREVLADAGFGELYVAGERPGDWRHVFASVQSLTALGVDRLPTTQFSVVVVDEFHHAEAATYRRLLEHLEPSELLGLTATPERTDGVDVRSFFGGRAAAELRLWEALEADLLCPFHYFGVSDGTDLSQLGWRRGDYDLAALEHVYTADDARLRIVLREVRDKVPDLASMRALGFCVSVAHAAWMAERFRAAGIPSAHVSGSTSAADRAAALRALRDGELKVLFAVDLFNEGLDVPDVDTLLLLRPTQSATLFLQQLGRGLRRTPTKPVLTVLDFIGQQRREFRFDLKYRALTGASRARLLDEVEKGFAYLPSGCELVLDRVAQQVVLDNVRRQLRLTGRQLIAELSSHGDLPLAGWLSESGRELADVFRFGSWQALRRAAGFPVVGDPSPLHRRGAAFAHVDDPERAAAYLGLLDDGPGYDELDERRQTYARMLLLSVWPDGGRFSSFAAMLDALRGDVALCDDITQVVGVALAGQPYPLRDLEPGMERVALVSHAHYSREEILAAIGYASLERTPKSHMTGVVWSEATRTDALMVTLQKAERDYSPTTRYRDYALGDRLFHWESQNATSADSPVGRRYREHRRLGSHVLLLARETRTNDWGGPAPYLCLGPVEYVGHVGERPMAITWSLRHPMPGDVLHAASVVA